MLAEKHPFTSCPHSKAPKCNKFGGLDRREEPVDSSMTPHGRRL